MKSKLNKNHSILLITLSLVIAICLISIQPASGNDFSKVATPTRTRTKTPTRTPTRTPTLTPWIPRAFDPRIITWGSLGGGGAPICLMSDNYDQMDRRLREGEIWIEYVDHLESYGESGAICIFGFPMNDQVNLTLFTPDGHKAAQFTLLVENIGQGSSLPIAWMNIYPSLSLPHGKWRMVAQGRSYRVEGNFWVGVPTSLHITVSHEVDSSVINPRDVRFRTPFSVGEVIVVKGIAFKPNADLRLGFFTSIEGTIDYKPVMGEIVRTDRNGDFTLAFPLDRRFTPGDYIVVPISDLRKKVFSWPEDFNARFQVIQPKKICNSAPLSRLKLNVWARLSAGAPNNVRADPGYSGTKLGKIYAYQNVYIIDGPKCKDGFTWWKIETRDKNLVGWTAEGDRQGYWLLPLSYEYLPDYP